MKEVHLSAFDSLQKFDDNMCEATGSQIFSKNSVSPYFPEDMFAIAIFEIEATGYF